VICIVNDEQSVNDVFKKMNGYEYSIDIEQFQFAQTPYNSFSTWKLSYLRTFLLGFPFIQCPTLSRVAQ
jgi:hypothetical protein